VMAALRALSNPNVSTHEVQYDLSLVRPGA